MKIPLVQCAHWQHLSVHGGRCSVGHGKVSPGVCERCVDYSGPATRVIRPDAPAVPDNAHLFPARVAEVEGFKAVCQTCPDWLGHFLDTPGIPVATSTKCDACSCPGRKVNLLTGNCPRKKWSQA
jgi:hypothetical protein